MGYMYILKCADGSYYTGSTVNLELRLQQHQNGEGANYTKKRVPVELVYFEEYERIDEAFYREKQVQGWSRKKKEALINGNYDQLPSLAKKVFRKEAVASIRPLRGHSATAEKTKGVVERSRNAVVERDSRAKSRESRNVVIEQSRNAVIEQSRNAVVELSRNAVVECSERSEECIETTGKEKE